ncbi:Cof-type HAD-IIB family hydrolase [Flavitalea sp. BT771]|uniref:Cof-type HAD-IIB family hydrolase n=1 Tax=Flavitalea sp. BT771 TaxID=3063329 RepID=UPI0026E37320|nr:Cof-type HAD-IIB family hydrolase [Flavitalea sp. BT771]MDO6431359.1 Cof-type HAD-IIB family hydrolase [Flavitalea sp. BT771]MDV6220267.1 Cof-type HAD-IIB family hydrolase [Flavitalea sp. BT771]
MYKAVFLDMDGTLLRSDHSVSEPTKDMIRHLTREGIPVILVSARPLNAILPTFRAIGIPDHYPLVSLNGSYIVEGEKPVFDARIDLEMAEAVSGKVRPFGATIAYYLQREWFAEVKDAWTDHEQRIMDVQLVVAPLADLVRDWSHRGIAPNKMMVMSEAANIDQIQQHLRSVYNGRLNIYPSKPTYLEVMDPRGSKSNAVQWLIQRMNIDRSEVIAMGDNYNDREMIAFAGMGVAMGNAPDEIKAAADFVTDTNNNDGVRKALEKFFG